MIYHIFKGAPQIANPKIKEILRFYKPFRQNPHGARTPATERGGERGQRGCTKCTAFVFVEKSKENKRFCHRTRKCRDIEKKQQTENHQNTQGICSVLTSGPPKGVRHRIPRATERLKILRKTRHFHETIKV